MDFLELVNKRESCRKFSDKEIDKEMLEKVVEIARLSPSAVNSQPWKMHIVISKDLRKKIADYVSYGPINSFAKGATAFIVVTENKEKLLPKVVSNVKELDFVSIDIGIFVAHITLALTSLGLSSCILGWFNNEKIKNLLNINEKVRLVIAVGYSNNQPRKKVRKPFDDIRIFY